MTAAATQVPSPSPGAQLGLPSEQAVLGRASTENFPVASLVLPAAVRADLMALYGWARLVDQLGDDYTGDRMAALDEVERQLLDELGPMGAAEAGARAGTPGPNEGGPQRRRDSREVHPLVATMAATVRRGGLPHQPLLDLAQANRQDQVVKRYETFEELVGYCALSADPVGRMVLAIFGMATPQRVAWSDKVCTALQLVEHWQDVAEDAAAGRVYLPQEDMRRFGVTDADLSVDRLFVDRPSAPGPGWHRRGQAAGRAQLRWLLSFESARARHMLNEGTPLVGSLPGRLKFAVAGFVAGGHAAIDALEAIEFDPFAGPAKPTKRRWLTHLARLLAPGTHAAGSAAGSTAGSTAGSGAYHGAQP